MKEEFITLLKRVDDINDAIDKIRYSFIDVNILEGHIWFFLEDEKENLTGCVDYQETDLSKYGHDFVWKPEYGDEDADKKQVLLKDAPISVKVRFLSDCLSDLDRFITDASLTRDKVKKIIDDLNL